MKYSSIPNNEFYRHMLDSVNRTRKMVDLFINEGRCDVSLVALERRIQNQFNLINDRATGNDPSFVYNDGRSSSFAPVHMLEKLQNMTERNLSAGGVQ